jgi:hypothetical protein
MDTGGSGGGAGFGFGFGAGVDVITVTVTDFRFFPPKMRPREAGFSVTVTVMVFGYCHRNGP